MVPFFFKCQYLQKDSIQHFNIDGGNSRYVYLHFKSD